jgi:maltokinase
VADRDDVRDWHAAARRRLDEASALVGTLDDAPVGPEPGARPAIVPSRVLAGCRDRMAAVLDRLLDLAGPVPVQRVHGDLHAGQLLRWTGGLAIVDFDGNPVVPRAQPRPESDPAVQPAARDLAQLMVSMDHVGRVTDRRAGFGVTAAIDAWSGAARAQLLAGYRQELAGEGRADLLDERLLAPFAVEQICREIIYAARFLPRWGYAAVGGLELLVEDPLGPPSPDRLS